MNCITLNTDASFHPDWKVGGYAFYFRHETIFVRYSGVFKGQLDDSTEAEMKCIANGLAAMLRVELPKVDWFIINTDSKASMAKIKHGSDDLSKLVRKLRADVIGKLRSTNNRIRHVKAHSNIKDKRSWVNDWCDRKAKEEMRRAVAYNIGKGRKASN